MTEAQDWVTFLLALAGLLGVLVTHFRWVRPRYRRWRAQFIAARDSIIGRPAELDSITGVERVPALPGIGVRMASTEEHLGVLAKAVASIAESHKQLEDHEKRITDLEAARVERIVGRAESAAAYRAMEAAVKAQPDEEPGL